MRIGILGTGYVGLTTAVAFAHLGHRVACVDIDERKIAALKAETVPFHEPGLAELLRRVHANMSFTTDAANAVAGAEIIFITVGTPARADGSPDLGHVEAAARTIGEHLGPGLTVIVNKSTVPIGSGNWVDAIAREAFTRRNGKGAERRFAVASNPEFLREGSAVRDMFYPDRVVIGADDRTALEILERLYRPIVEQSFTPPVNVPRPEGLGAVPLIKTDVASAELMKYAANAFLALKISYINEIATISERVGADIQQVAKGIGLDSRIGTKYLQAGIGWGGSCFAKDTAALIATAQEYGLTMPIVAATREVNARQRERAVEKLLEELKILKGRNIGLLGLAFKPDTDDLRDAPSVDIARRLQQRGARVRVHDPVAIPAGRRILDGSGIQLDEDPFVVAQDTDALVLVTEWPQYRELDWERVAKVVRNRLVVDGRNHLDRERLVSAGFRYVGMGR